MEIDFPTPGLRSEWLPLDDRRYTAAEYLAFDRADLESKNMYVAGRIFEFDGSYWLHGSISVNVLVIVASQLKTTPFFVRTSRTCVYSGPLPQRLWEMDGMFFYPDLVVVEKTDFLDDHKDVTLNPKAIIEVLSPATEAFDRGEKFRRLRTYNSTLTDYLLVSQSKPVVEHFQRQSASDWFCDRYEGLDAKFMIASIGCTVNLADVYDRVQFAEE